jgi:Cyclin, N-terminal domain/Cyclin, C-terminal domain
MTMMDIGNNVEASSLSDIEDILRIMRKQESTIYRRFDYLCTQSDISDRVVDGSWRQRIVEWMYGVVDHCNLRRDSVAVAAYYLDLSLINGLVVSRREFQLAAMTALQLAIKLYDSTLVKLDSMVKLGRGLFNEQDVIDMEIKMLRALNWNVHPPTPVCFLRQFLRLLPPTVVPLTRYLIAEVTRFISEISVCLYKFVKYPPSVIAYAGMLLAIDRIDGATLPHWQRQQIFDLMANVAGLQHDCQLVVDAVAQLHLSLERNISLQELMNTIDAQCQDGYSRFRSNKGQPVKQDLMHSPRDVLHRSVSH